MPEKHLLQVQNLCVHFPLSKTLFSKKQDFVYAVNDVSFNLQKGETLGIVGESGCGKTTLGKSLVKLVKPTQGKVVFQGKNITNYRGADMKQLRQKIQIVFQNPYASLNPRKKIKFILSEPLEVNRLYPDKERRNKRIKELLDYVQLPLDTLEKYPHEFSGGQQQRISIARALAPKPDIIILDEAVSALDVSIQASVTNLLKNLQKELQVAYIFIAHDLNIVAHISHRVAVMYLGSIVEMGEVKNVYLNSKHPYTKALLSAIPVPDPNYKNVQNTIKLKGTPPSSIHLPTGCTFHPRCWRATNQCKKKSPELTTTQSGHHFHCYHPLQNQEPKKQE